MQQNMVVRESKRESPSFNTLKNKFLLMLHFLKFYSQCNTENWTVLNVCASSAG